MSFIQQQGLCLLSFLALACGQPDAAKGQGNSATAPREAAATVERASAPLDSNGGSRTEGMRSPGLVEPVSPQPAAGAAEAPPAFVAPYPRGAWRLASPALVDNVVLWADQILIRHDDTRHEVSFNFGYWFSVPPAPGRTREQALALAQEVAGEAAENPAAFPELARRYSEDLPARDEGGELGGLSATQMSTWPAVLDALAAIRPGQTSKVVETYYGFHIFRRREPPPEQTLSGVHLVIGHDRAEWLKVLARGPLPSRSREDALALATELSQQARAEPGRFHELVDRYSEHRDAVLGGDFGSWSTREPNPVPSRMRRLQQLAVGEVGAPVETNLGFEVILRTEPPARKQYAVRAARLPFDPDAPETADESRARVLARAEALARAYSAEPESFGASGGWPTATLQWQSGRGVPGVEFELEKLELGKVASSPVQAEFTFVIFQRLMPEPIALVRYETELPAPAHPDVRIHLPQLPPESARELLRESDRLTEPSLGLSGLELDQIRRLHEGLPITAPSGSPAAIAAIEHALDETQALLGPVRHELYLSALRERLASVLLGAPADSPEERGF